MNERILELIRDVGFTNSDLGDGRDQMLIEFAELIVRECVGIADEYDGVGSTIVSRIKQHFGVE
jgi:hypothetical protein